MSARCRATLQMAWPGIDVKAWNGLIRCELAQGHLRFAPRRDRSHLNHVYANVVLRWVGAPKKYRDRYQVIG